MIIAALLWVLAWAERSPALTVIVAIYLATALVVTQFTNGGLAGGDTGAADLAMSQLRLLGLLPALVLLAAGAWPGSPRRLHLRVTYPCQRRLSQWESSTANRPELAETASAD